MPEMLTIADCDRAVRDAEAAIEQLHKRRRDDGGGGWHFPITTEVRATMAGHLLARLRALRRREEIERGCS
jgi:hypothetical protein